MRCIRKASALSCLVFIALSLGVYAAEERHHLPHVPAEPKGVKTIHSPGGARIRYKEPGKQGVCETTPGVNSYAGYVDLDEDSHTFFWFFEARHDPANAPITLWLNGGPGSDSMIGLFEELGPCNISSDLKSHVNPYAFNEVSNLLFISQPLGVGFSYAWKELGSINEFTGEIEPPSFAGITGRFGQIDPFKVDTTRQAAEATWHVLQGFLGALPHLDNKVKSKTFNLWTESYGGHYGPDFFYYFEQQNDLIAKGKQDGVHLHFNSLGIINGIIDMSIQAPQYPRFAAENTYGIHPLNDTVINFMNFANSMSGGCQDTLSSCKQVNRTGLIPFSTCSEAYFICRDTVEGPWYSYSGRGTYDIRAPSQDPTPPNYFADYLNTAAVQDAVGVDLNYTGNSSPYVYAAFTETGDWIWPNFIDDLSHLLELPIRVSLMYGDADYICNWFGGEAVSLAVNYSNAEQFRSAGYTPMVIDGVEYGETRAYGNFSFTRVYESGHEIPFYQPVAALQLFNRSLFGWDIPTGQTKVTANLKTNGTAKATHVNSYVPLPTSSASGSY